MDSIVENLLKVFPQLGFLLVITLAFIYLVKAYKGLHQEIRTIIDETLNSRLGSILGQLELKSHDASDVLKGMQEKFDSTKQLAQDYGKDMERRYESISQVLKQFEQRFQFLWNRSSGDLEGANWPAGWKIPASQCATGAQYAKTILEAEKYIDEGLADPDARSGDLEILGDVAYKFHRYTLAKSLYASAVDRDPENVSAKAELLATIAETERK